MSSTPAGWYPDPWKQATLRYWDGTNWTSSTNATQAPTPTAVQPASSGFKPPTTHKEKGNELEQQIARFLRTLGYEARTNVVLTGRSGATHEIDVLGEKSDQLTTFRVAVECKAWEQPIEKDVVAKLHYVLGDLGLREGIIACLSGYRSGAETAAREMGITLWGPDELRSRLGQVALSDISTGAPKKLATGLPFTLTIEQARPLFEKETKGKLGIGAEEIVWVSPAWLPVAVVQVALTSVEGRLKKVAQTRRIWNAYELLDGGLVASFPGPPQFVEVDIRNTSLRPKQKDAAAARAIEDAVGKYKSVSTEAAQLRHAQRLGALGIPAPFRAVPESTTTAFMPIYIAIARRREGERLIAVDGHHQRVHPRLNAVLTQHSHWVRESFSST
ncbi:unannotated protein [freshwater metagenome]|uniref:Unannotated protein n=1 Tax=freshwater metagenome TaxID=449393 RepID=A0A6J7KH25_9ZZZZ